MLVYNYTDYPKYLANYLKDRKITQREVASKTGIHVAYFSRVLKGEMGADFSDEQLYLISNYLKLSEDIASYLSLLLKYSRASINSYKKYIKSEIEKIQEEKLSVKSRIDEKESVAFSEEKSGKSMKQLYFQKWYYTEVYLLLSIKRYRNNLKLIAEKLRLELEKIYLIIDDLSQMGLASRSGNKAEYIEKVIHLAPEDHLVSSHHYNWRHKAIEHINNEEGWHFTVGISIKKSQKKEIEQRFKDFMHEIYLLTRDTESVEDTYHICIDLF